MLLLSFFTFLSHADEKPKAVIIKVEEVIPPYGNRLNFYFTRLGYEHIKPTSIYVALEGWYLPYISSGKKLKSALFQGEARIGYNFLPSPNNRLTPCIGVGYFRDLKNNQKQTIGFSSLGLRYEHQFNRLFHLGLNTEGLLGYSIDKENRPWGNPIWGFDVGLPLTFCFTKKRNWDFRFEPFVTYFYGKNATYAFGGTRCSFGYRF